LKTSLIAFVLTMTSATAGPADTLRLGNDPWPPFLVVGETQGMAEQLVCEALDRAGWTCAIEFGDWEGVLERAERGALDGIAALWFTPQRGRALHYSAPYLTNRLVPVTRSGAPEVRRLEDLEGLRVAQEVAAAYGAELGRLEGRFTPVPVRSVEAALRAVRDGEADAAVADELIVRDFMEAEPGAGLVVGSVALTYRELHFAVSRARPDAQAIIAGFNAAYQDMLGDGTVNRILDMEWLATDLGADGIMDFIHRGGGLDAAVAAAAESGSGEPVYALGQDDWEALRDPGFVGSSARFLADEGPIETPEAAMRDLETDPRCRYDSGTARVVCTGR